MRTRSLLWRIVLPALGGAAAACLVVAMALVILAYSSCAPGSDKCARPEAASTAAEAVPTVGIAEEDPRLAASGSLQPADQVSPFVSSYVASPRPAASEIAAGELALHVVRSVRIGPGGQPVVPTTGTPPTAAPTASPADEVAGLEPDADGTEPIEAPVPMARPPGLSQPAASDDHRTIVGGGVNVRAGPSSSETKLYVLAAEESVRVLDQERNWLKVLDDRGRTGWIDQDYVR